MNHVCTGGIASVRERFKIQSTYFVVERYGKKCSHFAQEVTARNVYTA